MKTLARFFKQQSRKWDDKQAARLSLHCIGIKYSHSQYKRALRLHYFFDALYYFCSVLARKHPANEMDNLLILRCAWYRLTKFFTV